MMNHRSSTHHGKMKFMSTKTPDQKVLELKAYMNMKGAASKKRSEASDDTVVFGPPSYRLPSVRQKITCTDEETPRLNIIS